LHGIESHGIESRALTRAMTMMTKSNCNSEFPEAAREQLLALQARYRLLTAQLPTDPNELADIDPADFSAALDNIELIASEMQNICYAQRAIIDGLARH
jgi:hypothetical protein